MSLHYDAALELDLSIKIAPFLIREYHRAMFVTIFLQKIDAKLLF